MTEEEWRSVVDYEGLYEVSNLARVRSLDRVDIAGRNIKGRVMKLRLNRTGYWIVPLFKDGKRKMCTVHRLVAKAFIGPAPEGKTLVLHGDGDSQNSVVSNLRWGDQSENLQDAVRHGTHAETRKTHCPQNHEYTEENTAWYVKGGRQCKTCRAIRNARASELRKLRRVA